MPEPRPLKVCNRIIGTHTVIDDFDYRHGFQVYNFIPAPGVALPEAESLAIDYTNGVFEVWSSIAEADAKPISTHDLISILHAISPSPATID